MFLYHGTTQEKATQIVECGFLSPYPVTIVESTGHTPHAICMTDDPYIAKGFGVRVFEIELDKRKVKAFQQRGFVEYRLEECNLYVGDGGCVRLMTEDELPNPTKQIVVGWIDGNFYPLEQWRKMLKESNYKVTRTGS